MLRVAEVGEAVVGRLGGLPRLPEGVVWPAWEGHGPLSFVAAVECAALPRGELDVVLPEGGTLAFFCFDGSVDDGDALVMPDDRESWAGARVLYVPAEADAVERAAPAELKSYPEVPLAASVAATAAEPWAPAAHAAFAPAGIA
ncbi:DUF1963 domain-containing protein [Streptomyces coryli]|uniref:DUF1963 domain-containing protein n=1 Tax=Streptomyces coryli TaxID=1128680 RepID=UPI001F0F0260|nr:DUF1963 domain-containing protein [Streptomyces coryli]